MSGVRRWDDERARGREGVALACTWPAHRHGLGFEVGLGLAVGPLAPRAREGGVLPALGNPLQELHRARRLRHLPPADKPPAQIGVGHPESRLRAGEG